MVTQSTLVAARHAIRQTLMAIANGCFIGTLLTDVAYWRSAEMMWADFSAWLLLAGLVLGVVAFLAALVELVGRGLSDAGNSMWMYRIGSVAVLVVSFFNALVHSRDAWTSVVPTGVSLSAVAVVILLVSTLLARNFDRARAEEAR